jgi:hypothetical protein
MWIKFIYIHNFFLLCTPLLYR